MAIGLMAQIKDTLVNLQKLTGGCGHGDSLTTRDATLEKHMFACNVLGQADCIHILALTGRLCKYSNVSPGNAWCSSISS